MMKAAVFTLNTELYNEKKESTAAVALKRVLEQVGFEVRCGVLPSDRDIVETVIKRLADSGSLDLLVTAGHIGITKDDIAPEIIEEASERLLPGIPEAVRAFMTRFSKKIALDRSTAGIRNNTVLLCLTENPKEAKESMEYIAAELVRAVEILKA